MSFSDTAGSVIVMKPVSYNGDAAKIQNPGVASSDKESTNEGEELVKKSSFPKSILFIVGNEFCERFSYFGLRAILVLYFVDHLMWGNGLATGVYHAFIVFCYFTPVIGAILADGYIGKYRTILYLSLVYTLGSVIMTFTAFPPPFWLGPMIGLLLIAFGMGGIKPCVSAFGGDQYKENQESERNKFFSVFYFSINLGSFLSIILTPLIKDGVTCFGKKCFALAFAVPAMLMFLSTGLFVWGRRWYTINPPPGSVITNLFKCVGSALKNRCKSGTKYKEHWLDYAGPEYQTSFLQDVKRVFKVLLIYLPVPVFWALFDQQGSRWTIQSVQLDRRLNDDWFLLPEQIQAINPILILLFIPIFEFLVYPLLNKLNIPNRPLQRMVAGMMLASLSFVSSGLLQISINNALPSLDANNSLVTFVNEGPCDLLIGGSMPDINMPSHYMSQSMSVPSTLHKIHLEKTSNSCLLDLKSSYVVTMQHPMSYLVVSTVGGYNDVNGTDVPFLVTQSFSYDFKKEPTGESYLRLLLVGSSNGNITSAHIIGINSKKFYSYALNNYSDSEYIQTGPGRYNIELRGDNGNSLNLNPIAISNGGKYTVIINTDQTKVTSRLVEDVSPNSISVWLQFPQYVIITLGEVVFAVTGLSFAYTEAPPSMKSVVQAAWLLTTAFGNIIDVIIASANVIPNQAMEFFFYAVLMFVTTIIFAIISSFYHYVNQSQFSYENLDDQRNSSSSGHLDSSYKQGEGFDQSESEERGVTDLEASSQKSDTSFDKSIEGTRPTRRGPHHSNWSDKSQVADLTLNH